MKLNKPLLGAAILILVLIIAFLSMFTVLQPQRAIILRLGKIETNAQGQAKIR